MSNYRLSPLAEKYLFRIISATIEPWGYTQTKIYAQTIDAALLKLAQYPDFGIDVAHILHQRMDITKRFLIECW